MPAESLSYEPQTSDEQNRRRFRLNLTLALSAFVLSAASLLIVMQGAGEPFVKFYLYEAVMQIGVASALILLWCIGGIAILFLVFRRKLSFFWLLLLPWIAICIFYLYICPTGYIEDIHRFDPGAIPF